MNQRLITLLRAICLLSMSALSLPLHEAYGTPVKVFWCSDGNSFPSAVGGTLSSVDPDGSNLSLIRTASGSQNIRGCEYDRNSNLVFFASGGVIYRTTTTNTSETTMQNTGTIVDGIVIDSAASRMYWADTVGNTINYASNSTALASPLTLVSGAQLNEPVDIEIDSANSKLYWANHGTSGSDGSIARVNLNGTTPEIIIPSLSYTWGVAVDASHNRIFYSLPDISQIWTAALDGSNPVNLTSTIGSVTSPRDIDYDVGSNKIYWVQFSTPNGSLRRANPDGTGAETLVTSSIPRANFLSFLPDTTTTVPSLISPAASTAYLTDLPINYTLGEAALPGTTRLFFLQSGTPQASITMMDALSVSTTIQPFTSTVSLNPSVTSSGGFPIAEGTYDIMLTYQDALGNPAGSTTNAGVVLALPTPTPTATPTSTPIPTNTPTPTPTPTSTPIPECTSSLKLPGVKLKGGTATVSFAGAKGAKYKVFAVPVGAPIRNARNKSIIVTEKGKQKIAFEKLKSGAWSFSYRMTVKKVVTNSCGVEKVVP